MKIPQEIKNRITTRSGNSTSWYIPKRIEITSQRDICTPVFITGIIHYRQIWKQPKYPSMNGWRKHGLSIQWEITQPYKGRKF